MMIVAMLAGKGPSQIWATKVCQAAQLPLLLLSLCADKPVLSKTAVFAGLLVPYLGW